MSARLERSKLISVLKIILKPLIRELSTTDDASIDNRRIAKSASIIVKKKCGAETYNENCSIIQRILNARRALRRKASLLQVSYDKNKNLSLFYNTYIYILCMFIYINVHNTIMLT